MREGRCEFDLSYGLQYRLAQATTPAATSFTTFGGKVISVDVGDMKWREGARLRGTVREPTTLLWSSSAIVDASLLAGPSSFRGTAVPRPRPTAGRYTAFLGTVGIKVCRSICF